MNRFSLAPLARGSKLPLWFLLFSTTASPAAPNTIRNPAPANMPESLAQSDPVWNKLPTRWADAPFFGNGFLGMFFYRDAKAEGTALNFVVNRTDTYDHRNAWLPDGSAKGEAGLPASGRLPNGRFVLPLAGAPGDAALRLDLWNAELTGTVGTSEGALGIRTFTHATRDLVVIEFTPSGNLSLDGLDWKPYPALVPLSEVGSDDHKAKLAGPMAPLRRPYPEPAREERGGIFISIREMPESPEYHTQGCGEGQYATAWKWVGGEAGGKALIVSMAFSHPGRTAADTAVAGVKAAIADGLPALRASHRAWWHEHWGKSFFAIPDARLNQFYQIQNYKLGCLTRADGPMIDLNGPWFPWERGVVRWPGIWWNLNTQLIYSSVQTPGYSDLGLSLLGDLERHRDALFDNVNPWETKARENRAMSISHATGRDLNAKGGALGDFAWVLHPIWEQYRVTMDQRILERLYPFLLGSLRHYQADLKEGADGKLHLPRAFSPEYTHAEDTNYELAPLRWLCRAIIEAEERLATDEGAAAECQKILERLTAYPENPEQGFLIGRDVPFDKPHRHYSHLLMIHPFGEFHANRAPEDAARARLSIEHFVAGNGNFDKMSNAWPEFGVAGMWAYLGEGDKALERLNSGLNYMHEQSKVTFKYEAAPISETPFLLHRVLQELLLHQRGDVIAVFPAVPSSWRDAAFADFRARGGFRVSAKRAGGRAAFVQVTSDAGEPLLIQPNLPGPVKAHGARAFAITGTEPGVYSVDLKKGETVLLHSGGQPPTVDFNMPAPDQPNFWGLK